MKRLFLLAGLALVVAGCRINKTKDENGNTKVEVEPAKVELGTDTQTVTVPTVNVAPDTTKQTTSTNQ